MMDRDPLNLELENLREENRKLKIFLEARRKQVKVYSDLIDMLNAEIAEYEKPSNGF